MALLESDGDDLAMRCALGPSYCRKTSFREGGQRRDWRPFEGSDTHRVSATEAMKRFKECGSGDPDLGRALQCFSARGCL